MRLLQLNDTGDLSLTREFVGDDTVPPYVILSHTWGADAEEFSFADLTNGTGKSKSGYRKVYSCGEQARRDGLQYFWADTCCINKANYTELSYSINSMFRWYHNASRCYVYLADTGSLAMDRIQGPDRPDWAAEFTGSRWFTRDWTLQELIAPQSVEFFSKHWERLGDKTSLRQQIQQATGIPKAALQNAPLSQFSVQERLSWTSNRQTKLEEDKAYSLLGIFNVSMPLIYGEGREKAFKRLLEEVEKSSTQQWNRDTQQTPRSAVASDDQVSSTFGMSWIWAINIFLTYTILRFVFEAEAGTDMPETTHWCTFVAVCLDRIYVYYYAKNVLWVLQIARLCAFGILVRVVHPLFPNST